MPEPTHACPGRCGAQVPYAQLACKPCWVRLPKPLKDDINAAYLRRRHEPLAHLRAVQAARDWYQANTREDA